MKLALGTVQFGVNYGIAGRGEAVPESEVREILACANAAGIDTLDTAAAYGTIEERLSKLCAGLNFHVVSKLPALPKSISNVNVVDWAEEKFSRTQINLGEHFAGYLFHCAGDLLGSQGGVLWDVLSTRCRAANIMLGVSYYAPEEHTAVQQQFPLSMVQIPANVLDRRFSQLHWRPSTVVHLRSAFLQGLLLMPFAQAIQRVPAAEDALRHWHYWCAEHGWSPLFAALSIAKGFAFASHCVLGVDSVKQLEDIVLQWERARPISVPELECGSLDVIDPRLWRLAS